MSHALANIAVKYPNITILSESDRYRLLASQRRRLAMEVLANNHYPMGLDELTTKIIELDNTLEVRNERHREEVKIALHHHHLPKMSDLGVISYDSESKQVIP